MGIRLTERVVEYPFVRRNLPKQGRVLDVGCLQSTLTGELVEAGYEACGVDIRPPHPHHQPNFILCDAEQLPFRENSFDATVSVSTTEHIGLISHGVEHIYPAYKVDPEGDRKATVEMVRVTKPKGVIIITLPYGLGKPYWLRIYNKQSLTHLLESLNCVWNFEYYIRTSSEWVKTSEEVCSRVLNEPEVGSVVCIGGLKGEQ